MAKSMTPSEMTAGQITKATSTLRAMLEKHASEFNAESVQMVLGQPEFIADCFANFRKRVEAVSSLITRTVTVNRDRSPREALYNTGRTVYCDDFVVQTMPRGEGEEVQVHFFKIGRFVSDSDLEKEYALRGFKPCDPYTLAAINEADPAFADKHPNGTHWKDAKDTWCFAAFFQWQGERYVDVRRGNDGSDDWWFAGLRK